MLQLLVGVWLCALLAACAAPYSRFDRVASESGLRRTEVPGTKFLHAVYDNSRPLQNRTLHVYINGDGLPWVARYFAAVDPTLPSTLALSLIQRDTQAGVLLGRPCYHGLRAAPCEFALWTDARFSPAIVESMVTALRRVVVRKRAGAVILIGHSGGGALAMLMAPQVPEVIGVVTVAGLLDTEAWTAHHRYSPLAQSLNPARQSRVPATISQLHLMGGRDINTPPALSLPVVAKQSNAQAQIVPDFGHVCCWASRWPNLLQEWLDTR